MNFFYSRISDMFKRIRSIIDGANFYIYFKIWNLYFYAKISLQWTGYVHAPRHTILIVYSIQKF